MRPSNWIIPALAICGAFAACDTAGQAAAPEPEAQVGGSTAAAEATTAAGRPDSESTGAERPAAAEAQEPSARSGQLKFNNFCRTCHSMQEGDNRLGPSLHGIFGRKAGGSPDYRNYSQAMVTSGIVWDEATLDRFLANPDAVVPGNNMKPFSRIPDPGVRQDIIEHLKTAAAE